MDLPSFPLWQQAALRPSGARLGPRPPRRRTERSAATLERASGALSPEERRMVNLRVCDPATRLLVEPLLRGVSDLQELQDMAHGRGATLAGADPRTALPSLLGGL